MSVAEIYDEIEGYSSEVIFQFVKKMLKDEEIGTISIPSSIEDIERARDICKTIENSKNGRISGAQDYRLKMLFAEGICCYYSVKSVDDIRNLYKDIQINL